LPARAVRVLVVAAFVAAWSLAATTVTADGIPTPMPGAVEGPSGDTLRGIAIANGLTCQPDTVAPASEAFCNSGSAPGGEQDTATFYTNPGLVLVAAASTASPPLPPHGEDFLVAITAPFCEGGEAAVRTFYDNSVAQGFGTDGGTGYSLDTATCHLEIRGNETSQFAFRTMTAFSLIQAGGPVPSVLPSLVASLLPSAAPVATSAPAGPGTGTATSGGGPPHPAAFAKSIASPANVSTDLGVLAQSALLALAIVLLMPFPASLFNSTLDAHYDEIRGWFPRFRLPGGRGGFWRSRAGVATFIAVSAVLYASLDPDLGLSAESLAEVVGIGLGIVVTALAFEVPSLVAHRRLADTWRIEVLPGTIVVAVVCVLISRLTGFLPGYVYGLILGLSFAKNLSEAEEGRNTALAGVLMLVLAVTSWFALTALGSGTGVLEIAAQTILAAVMVGGLEGVVFGLVPLRFLQGEALWAWNRVVWGVVFGLGVFAFAHILLNPQSGYLSDSSRTPFLTIVALFLGFGAVSVGFWGYFRFRPARPEPASEGGGPGDGSAAG
jgi:hypothetical protein